jgi:ABC-type transport system substrate-binding protein
LEANTDYFEAPPRLGEIHIKTVSPLNAQENFRDFAEGNVDIAFVPSNRVGEVQANSEWVYWSRPILRFMYLGFNLNAPLVKERALRKAICLAINRSKLVGNDPDYSVLCNLLPLSLLGSNPGQTRDPYDPQAAREALRRMPDRKRQDLRVTLWHAALSEERQRLLSLLASDLSNLGVDVELKIEPSLNALLERVYSGQTQMFLLGEVFDFPDPGAVLNRLFHSRSKGNLFAYNNAKVDRMLEEVQALADENQRAQLYGQIERRILDDYVVAPLFQVKYSIVTRRAVQGIELSPLGFQYLPFRKVWLKPEVNN